MSILIVGILLEVYLYKLSITLSKLVTFATNLDKDAIKTFVKKTETEDKFGEEDVI